MKVAEDVTFDPHDFIYMVWNEIVFSFYRQKERKEDSVESVRKTEHARQKRLKKDAKIPVK